MRQMVRQLAHHQSQWPSVSADRVMARRPKEGPYRPRCNGRRLANLAEYALKQRDGERAFAPRVALAQENRSMPALDSAWRFHSQPVELIDLASIMCHGNPRTARKGLHSLTR